VSEHEPFVCAECERDEAIKERDAARKEVAVLTERRQRLLATVRGAFKRLRRLRDEALAKYQFMFDRVADEKLDGYRELAARVAAAENERDEWRVSEQETSREYHELRDLNTKVRSILMAPLDTTTDDAAWGVVHERDRLYAEVQKLTAERKDILDQRDEARQQRDEAQKLAVERGELIEGLKHDLKRSDAECQKAWEHRDALASRFRSIDRALMIETGDAEATLQAVQKVAAERRQAVIDLDYQRAEACKADQRAARLAEELERTKTLLAEHKVREAKQHENWENWTVEVRDALRVGPDESTAEVARRLVAERDELREQWVEPRDRAKYTPARSGARDRVPLDGAEAQALEHALTITERERDQAREQAAKLAEELERTKTLLTEDRAELRELRDRERDAKQALKPTALPPGLRWDWSGSAFDGTGRWEALCESLIVGRVEQCGATGCTPAGWRWQRLDGTRDWGIEDDEHTALSALARHLREHTPLAAAALAEPEPDPELPPGLRWVWAVSAGWEPDRWDVRDGPVIVARVEPWQRTSDDPVVWRWQRLGLFEDDDPKRQGIAPTEYGARAVLARRLRAEAADTKKRADIFAIPPGLSWRVVGAFKVQVVKTDGEVVAESVPDGNDRWSWWMADPRLPPGLKIGGEGPSEPEARATLAAAVREAYGSREPSPDLLPQGLSWRHLGAFKAQVLNGSRVVGEYVCVGTNRWSWWMMYPKSPTTSSVSGHEEMSGYEARAALVAALRKAHASCEPPPSEPPDPLALPPGLVWMKWLEDGAWNWGVYRDGSPLGRLLAKVMKHQSLRDVWYWILYGYVIDDDSQGIIDGPCFGSQYNARVALAALLRRIGAGSNG
jgi:hypothetical protein